MKPGSRKKLFAAVLTIAICVMLWQFVSRPVEPPINNQKDELVIEPVDQQGPVAVSKPPKPNKSNSKTVDEFLGADLADKFDELADAYQQTARYPANSQVIVDADLVATKKPFQESEVELKFPDGEGGELPVSLAAATDKFQYFNGETIIARVIVNGAQENDAINATAVVVSGVSNEELSAENALDFIRDTNNEYRAEFDSGLFAEKSIVSEMFVKFNVDVNEQNLIATVPFKFGTAAARLDSMPYTRAEGEFLLLPLQFSVFESGYYFVDAILEDASSGRPLVQLQTEGRMKSGNDIMLLRAHQQALKDAGSQGPYNLRVRNAFRGAEPSEVADTPVALPLTGFGLPAVAFSEYEDVQYTDPDVQQRIDFLKGLGSGSKSEE